MSLAGAGLIAMAISFLVYIVIAVWYAAPWMTRQTLALALSVPLWVHVFRYIALQIFSAQHFGFQVSNALANEIAWGDVAGALLALAALWLLRSGSRIAVVAVWVFAVETALDLLNATIGGIRESAYGSAVAVTWMILSFYTPLLWVTLALVVWRLVTQPRMAD